MIPVIRLQINICGVPSPLDDSEIIYLFVSRNNNITDSQFGIDIFRFYGVDYLGHAMANGAEVIIGEVYFVDRASAEKCAAWMIAELKKIGYPVDPQPARDYLAIPTPLGWAIWFRRPEFRNVAPIFRDIVKTHAFVIEIPACDATNPEAIFMMMQGEIWSPNGEARELIRGLGLDHTSMSIGDIVVDPQGVPWVVAYAGFERLPG